MRTAIYLVLGAIGAVVMSPIVGLAALVYALKDRAERRRDLRSAPAAARWQALTPSANRARGIDTA